MTADDARRLQELSAGLGGMCQSWLVMREALTDILRCAASQEMGQAQRLAFITTLARSALESADKA